MQGSSSVVIVGTLRGREERRGEVGSDRTRSVRRVQGHDVQAVKTV